MPIAEIIAIGTELLLGEIQDTNTQYLARKMRDIGVDIYRASIIGDNAERLSKVIRETQQRADILITTGGLGPTVDDPTRLAVSMAVDKKLEYQPELWEQIQERFQRYGRKNASSNNKRQAYIPAGSQAISNPVGTAPSFIVEDEGFIIISLPGVPREMEYLMENNVIPYLKDKFSLRGTIKARVLHTIGLGESHVDELIGDLEKNTNPTVGLLAHAGQVDVRVTAKANSQEEAEKLINETATIIYQRLGNHIYGTDDQNLESIVAEKIKQTNSTWCFLEHGITGELARRLSENHSNDHHLLSTDTPIMSMDDLFSQLAHQMQKHTTPYGLGVSLIPEINQQTLHLCLITPDTNKKITRSFGGHPALSILWAANLALDTIRRYS